MSSSISEELKISEEENKINLPDKKINIQENNNDN